MSAVETYASGGLVGDEVFVAGEQYIYAAPIGTEIPDDVDDDLEADWVNLGYTTEDGLTISLGKDTDDLLTSQSLDPVRKLVTGAPKTIVAPLRQVNKHNLVLALGGGVITGDRSWRFRPAPASFIDYRSVVVEGVDGAKRLRLVFYRCMVSEAVEFTLVNTASIIFPLTFSVLANEPYTFEVFGDLEGETGSTPNLASVTPDEGAAGDTVALAGTNFAVGMTVSFAAAAATNVERTSATAATCDVPAGTGTVDVIVRNPGVATPGTLANAFTYE